MTRITPVPDHGDRLFHRLAVLEMLERFSLHGMKALLTLYLVDAVLATGQPSPWGLAALRGVLERLWGTMTPLAFASQLYGLYGALAYLALPFGGMVGDRSGRRGAILAGAVAIALGHAALTRPALLLPALLGLIVGTGLLKANLTAQAGALFAHDDPRRIGAFARYLVFLNVGAMLGPLVCGVLAQRLGWAYGFAAAGVAMGAGILWFAATPVPPPVVVGRGRSRDDGRRSIGIAGGAIVVTVLGFCAYEQVANLFLLWIDRTIRRDIAGFTVPAAWFLAADGLLTIVMAIVTTRIGRLARLAPEDRLWLGCGAIAAGWSVLALLDGAGARGIAVPLVPLALLDLGIALLWPAALALVTTTPFAYPARPKGSPELKSVKCTLLYRYPHKQ